MLCYVCCDVLCVLYVCVVCASCCACCVLFVVLRTLSTAVTTDGSGCRYASHRLIQIMEMAEFVKRTNTAPLGIVRAEVGIARESSVSSAACR